MGPRFDDEQAVRKHLKVFVGSLPPSATEPQVGRHFSKYGLVLSASVVSPRDADKSRAPYAFVTFKFAADADASVVDTESSFPGAARPVTMGFATPRRKNAQEVQSKVGLLSETDPCKVFVGGIGEMDNEEEVGDFFSQWGLVALVYRDRTWGFVHFATKEGAQRLLEEAAIIYQRRRLDIKASDSKKVMDEGERGELIRRAVARHFHKKGLAATAAAAAHHGGPPPPAMMGLPPPHCGPPPGPGGVPPPSGMPGGYPPPAAGYYGAPPPGGYYGGPPPAGYYGGPPPGSGYPPPGYAPTGYPPPGYAPPGYPPPAGYYGGPPAGGYYGGPPQDGGPASPAGTSTGDQQRALPAPDFYRHGGGSSGGDPNPGYYARADPNDGSGAVPGSVPAGGHIDGGAAGSAARGGSDQAGAHVGYYRDSRDCHWSRPAETDAAGERQRYSEDPYRGRGSPTAATSSAVAVGGGDAAGATSRPTPQGTPPGYSPSTDPYYHTAGPVTTQQGAPASGYYARLTESSGGGSSAGAGGSGAAAAAPPGGHGAAAPPHHDARYRPY